MMFETNEVDMKVPWAAQYFAMLGGKDLAEIARVGHLHNAKNPYSQFKDVYDLEQILSSPTIFDPLTKLQCCPTSDSAVTAVLINECFLSANPQLRDRVIIIAGQVMTAVAPNTFSRSVDQLGQYDMPLRATQLAYKEAGFKPISNPQTPQNPVVVELHG